MRRGRRERFHSPAPVPSRPHSPQHSALLSPAPALHFRYTGAGRKRAGIGAVPRMASVAKQHGFWPRPPGARNLNPPSSSAAPLLAAGASPDAHEAGACVRSYYPELALTAPWVCNRAAGGVFLIPRLLPYLSTCLLAKTFFSLIQFSVKWFVFFLLLLSTLFWILHFYQ